jgi:CDP-glucose 4,6-dehydratase
VALGGPSLEDLAMTGIDPDFWRERPVLVTGHTGFKGAWLSLWLQSLGARVTGFSTGVPPRPSLYELARVAQGIDSVAGDVCDAAAVARAIETVAPEVVIHMAAQSLVRRSFASPRETFEANVMGTVNVLEAVRLRGEDVRAVVCVTSDKCYENDGRPRPYSEDDPLGGHDPYSSSKACAELVVQAFRRSFFGDTKVATARAGNVIGGGDWAHDRLVPDIMRAALADGEVHVRNPSSVRPWQHVLNPLSGYMLLAQSLAASPACAASWNFGPDEEESQTVGWIAQRIAELWPGQLHVSVDDGPHPHEARQLRLDSSRARAQLGWRPLVDLDAALEATVAWYRELRDGADMRTVTLDQIEALQSTRAGG